jgi:beta-mannosidase
MGIMYWQINDIWQAPTWATMEYGLKWKMGHYYVQHMYEPIYPLAILKPYLADVMDENARLSIYAINELFNGASGRLTCSLLPLDTFSVKSTYTYDVSFNAPDVKLITDLSYSTEMKSAGCSNSSQCLFHCSFNSTQEDIGQTLFLSQPKNYQLYQPNLRVESFKQVSATEVSITITATRPALFVWLDVPADVSGYFSRNGFHMFEPTRTVSFYSWAPMTDVQKVNLNVAITSLFDVTQP